MLRRLKPLGASVEELLDVYMKQIRCLLEFASPVWTGGLTEESDIERIQKAAFAIILTSRYTSYDMVLTLLNMTSLTARRGQLNLKFAQKCSKSEVK